MDTLTEKEKELVSKIEAGKLEEVESLLNDRDVKINKVDENGMSFLHTAAYRGNEAICRLLIERGANVNSNEHVHSYSPLMFAAIGGHLRVVNCLLEAGANVNHVNSVGRTASQMAAFVGQHQVVSMINNYIPKEELEYFTVVRGLEKSPRLSKELLNPLHSFIRQTNINPVRLTINLCNYPELIENGKQIVNILESLCEREMKKADPNEVLALKYHYFQFLFRHILKHIQKCNESKDEKYDLRKSCEILIKKWIKGRDVDDFPLALEAFLRQSIREFPYRDSALFIQLVKTLSGVEMGNELSALTILSQTVNGQKGFDDSSPVCATCGEPNPGKKCSRCKQVQYCNQDCQRLHWFTHKKHCFVCKEETEEETHKQSTGEEDKMKSE